MACEIKLRMRQAVPCADYITGKDYRMSDTGFHAVTAEMIEAGGAYEVVSERYLEDIDSDSFILRHKKTGARIALLPNEDSNKVFYIGFRTPPKDSTGVAHIIEHTVLCGSRDFPCKDPFVELVKGSLNTFLNAMTYPDKTVYPVASTNDKDFANLMHVYLDAVFHPNIYTEQNIFRQEGWHYEVADDGTLSINGVVYNEMKGVMSSPDDVLGDKMLSSLYPDTTYAINSGGDPEYIPQLTYEAYLDFHRKYYHPSNSYIYLYGNMDMVERLSFLDEAYLGRYEALRVDSEIQRQKAFDRRVTLSFPYSVMEDEDTEGKTYLSSGYSIPVNGAKENLAFKILDYVLCDAEGGPVREAIRENGIGEDVSSLYESGILQPMWSVTAKYAEPEQMDEFLETIQEVLEKLCADGIDPKALAAGINYFEFRYREAESGGYPKGLFYGLDALDTWLYDDYAVWDNLDIGRYFEELRRDAGNGYFEALLRRFLLDNRHRCVIMLTPEQGLTQKLDAKKKQELSEYAACLTSEQLEKIREEEAALRKWQETPDSREDLEKIPLLTIQDLSKKALPSVNERRGGMLVHPLFTSGIDYIRLVFDISDIPADLFPYLGVFKTLLGVLSTEKYTYAQLDQEINILTGGMSCSVGTYTDLKNLPAYRLCFEFTVKALHEHLKEAYSLMEEILLHTRYDDMTRILQVLEEERSGMKAELPAAGHLTALIRATSYFSKTQRITDETAGITALRFLDDLCGHFEEKKDVLRGRLEELAEFIFRSGKLLTDVTAQENVLDEVEATDLSFREKLDEKEASLPGEIKERWAGTPVYEPEVSKKNEAFTTAGQVQYVCCAGNFLNKGCENHGALRVLKVIMGYDYLWQRIRVKGGAYGCMSGCGKDGTSYFVTYRDPHLARSLEVFRQAPEYIRSFEADERTMTKSIIGAISALDRPLSPHLYGVYSFLGYMTNQTDEDMQRERDEILSCTPETIRSLAANIEAFLQDGCICVVGGSEKIKEHEDLFLSVEPLV